MAQGIRKARRGARYALGAIRLFNGTAALLAPETLGRRVGVDPTANPAAVYVLRLFGVRTVYVGGELLLSRGEHLRDALRAAPAIHVSDTLAAIAAGRAGQLPAGSARTATIISSVNVLLALLAATEPDPSRRRLGRLR
jgi:hypothetical protein